MIESPLIDCFYYLTFSPDNQTLEDLPYPAPPRGITTRCSDCWQIYKYIPWFALLNFPKIMLTIIEEEMDFD